MSRSASFAIFFLIALTILGSAHYYVWVRLIRDPAWPPSVHRVLTALLVVLYVGLPASLAFARGRVDGMRPLSLVAFGWMGVLFLLVVLLAVVDLGKLGVGVAGQLLADMPPSDPERRLTLSRMMGAGVAVAAGGMGTLAARSGLSELIVKEIAVPLARLPAALTKTTIVQISDLHVGATIQKEFVDRVVDRANALEPDVIAITGDLVDGSVESLRDHVAPLGRLKARYGVYFVTGNHEYYSGADEWCDELRRIGIRVLRNERVSIGDGDTSFDLAGIDDYSAHRFGNGHGANLSRALEGRDPSRELVLLAHQPRAIHEAERLGVGLQLSGHTHGGQIFPWNFMVRLQQPVVSGLARIGRALVYVSNGTGYWGPPMRLGAPAEITKIVLMPAGD